MTGDGLEVEQREQPLEEEKALFDRGGAVVEDLAQEGVQTHIRAHVVLEEDQRVHLVLGSLGGHCIVAGVCSGQGLLARLVLEQKH